MNLNNRIPYLDGIRALAILMVLIGHGYHSFFSGVNYFTLILGNSHLGVMIFFCLSGFLITILLLNEKERFQNINFTKFYIRRSLRIFPVFYTYIFVLVILSFLGIIKLGSSYFIVASTYTWNYLSAFITKAESKDLWYLGHFWTLALEEQFYLFWPFIINYFNKYKIIKFLPVVLIVVFPINRVLTYFLFPALRGQIGMMLHTMSDSILWGACIAIFYKCYLLEVKDFYQKNRFLYNFIFVLILIFLFVISPILAHNLRGSYSITIGFTIESIGIAFLIFSLFVMGNKVFDFLNHKWIAYIGVLSYSLYIWQQLFLAKSINSLYFEFPLNYIFTFLMAYISYNTIEKFGLKFKKKFNV